MRGHEGVVGRPCRTRAHPPSPVRLNLWVVLHARWNCGDMYKGLYA